MFFVTGLEKKRSVLLWRCCFGSFDHWTWGYCSLQLPAVFLFCFILYIYIYIYQKWELVKSVVCCQFIMIELEFYYCLIKFKAPIVFVWLLGSSTSCCQISDLGVWTKTDWCFDLLIKSNSHGGDAIGCKAILFIPPKKEKKKKRGRDTHIQIHPPSTIECLFGLSL